MSYLDKNNPSSRFYEGPEGKANTGDVTRVSSVIDFTATGSTEAISIPLGALVKEVGVILTAVQAAGSGGGDVDVGDGDDTARYIDGMASRALNEYVRGPYPYTQAHTATAVVTALDEEAGRYYAAADTIDVLVNATATTGSGRVYVVYTLGDTLGT